MTADPASERHNSILAAQTRLAQELGDKPNMLRPYLAELLSTSELLFKRGHPNNMTTNQDQNI